MTYRVFYTKKMTPFLGIIDLNYNTKLSKRKVSLLNPIISFLFLYNQYLLKQIYQLLLELFNGTNTYNRQLSLRCPYCGKMYFQSGILHYEGFMNLVILKLWSNYSTSAIQRGWSNKNPLKHQSEGKIYTLQYLLENL
jgi:hypothetical protein